MIEKATAPPGLCGDSTIGPLFRMGLILPNGELDFEAMRVFAHVFAGQFFEALCGFYSDREQLLAVIEAFSELNTRGDHQGIYLMLSIQYDCMRIPMPDPVWCLAEYKPALKVFAIDFSHWLMNLTSITFPKEGRYDKTDDRSSGG